MKEGKDIRWQQRFNNFNKALSQLELFFEPDNLNKLEQQGLIKAFEYTYELAWKTLQDLLHEMGYIDVMGPKAVIEQAFEISLIEDGEEWVKMHKSRNLTSHSYNEETANEIARDVKKEYYHLFKSLQHRLNNEKGNNGSKLFSD